MQQPQQDQQQSHSSDVEQQASNNFVQAPPLPNSNINRARLPPNTIGTYDPMQAFSQNASSAAAIPNQTQFPLNMLFPGAQSMFMNMQGMLIFFFIMLTNNNKALQQHFWQPLRPQ